jgi:hypothetical protein
LDGREFLRHLGRFAGCGTQKPATEIADEDMQEFFELCPTCVSSQERVARMPITLGSHRAADRKATDIVESFADDEIDSELAAAAKMGFCGQDMSGLSFGEVYGILVRALPVISNRLLGLTTMSISNVAAVVESPEFARSPS